MMTRVDICFSDPTSLIKPSKYQENILYLKYEGRTKH